LLNPARLQRYLRSPMTQAAAIYQPRSRSYIHGRFTSDGCELRTHEKDGEILKLQGLRSWAPLGQEVAQGGYLRHRSVREAYLVVQRTRVRAHLKDLYLTRCFVECSNVVPLWGRGTYIRV
jgi:hypothetical protein